MEGVKADKTKVEAIAQWPTPSSIKDVRLFLGLASFYRRFIYHFSELATPFTNLMKKGIKWQWGEAEDKAFTQLKVALVSTPILIIPNFEKEFVLTTDASLVSVGAILQQDHGQGLQPVYYASKKLTLLNQSTLLMRGNSWPLYGPWGYGGRTLIAYPSTSNQITIHYATSQTKPQPIGGFRNGLAFCQVTIAQ